jgi:hypothetical protein
MVDGSVIQGDGPARHLSLAIQHALNGADTRGTCQALQCQMCAPTYGAKCRNTIAKLVQALHALVLPPHGLGQGAWPGTFYAQGQAVGAALRDAYPLDTRKGDEQRVK